MNARPAAPLLAVGNSSSTVQSIPSSARGCKASQHVLKANTGGAVRGRWPRLVCRLRGCAPAGPYEVWRRAALIGPGWGFGPFIIEASGSQAGVTVRARRCGRCGRFVTKYQGEFRA